MSLRHSLSSSVINVYETWVRSDEKEAATPFSSEREEVLNNSTLVEALFAGSISVDRQPREIIAPRNQQRALLLD